MSHENGGMSWIIIDLPISPVVSRSVSKRQKARREAHEKKFANGVYLPLGNGCKDCSDCFHCEIDIDKEGCHYGRVEKE